MLIFYHPFKMKLKDASLKHQTGRIILVLSQTEEILYNEIDNYVIDLNDVYVSYHAENLVCIAVLKIHMNQLFQWWDFI